jgi:hypothetical protein
MFLHNKVCSTESFTDLEKPILVKFAYGCLVYARANFRYQSCFLKRKILTSKVFKIDLRLIIWVRSPISVTYSVRFPVWFGRNFSFSVIRKEEMWRKTVKRILFSSKASSVGRAHPHRARPLPHFEENKGSISPSDLVPKQIILFQITSDAFDDYVHRKFFQKMTHSAKVITI